MTHIRVPDEEYAAARIILVDDEAHNVTLLEKLLGKYGYTNLVGINDALEVVAHVQAKEPDLILLDLNMPQKSGLDLLQELQPWICGDVPVPVLVLTGDGRTDSRRAALRAGARDYVTKPFDPPEVLTRIRNLLESRLLNKMLLQYKNNLETMVEERTRELLETQLELTRRLGLASEFRDDDTGMHIARVSQYAAILAEEAGLSAETCRVIQEAAPLHDIGKLGIPDRVLLKPGKLDPDEWELMKTHVDVGSQILSHGRCELIHTAEEIARTHHERWDGKGYPKGLSGEDIPLAGRIVSICDVFDALTSERPYKRAWEVSEAVAEIARNRGTQFDPMLVDCFMAALPRISSVRQSQGERVAQSNEAPLEVVR